MLSLSSIIVWEHTLHSLEHRNGEVTAMPVVCCIFRVIADCHVLYLLPPPPPVPPDPPSGFSSQDVMTDGFNLRWMTQFNGNSAITSAFVMYRVTQSSDPATNSTADAVTSHTLSGLMANTPYTVTVFLINAIGASSGGEHQVTTKSLR